jgi:hypothetical protein
LLVERALMASLKQLFDAHKGKSVHVRLLNSTEVDGTILFVGDDLLGVETTPGVTMVIPFDAVLFMRSTTDHVRQIIGDQ